MTVSSLDQAVEEFKKLLPLVKLKLLRPMEHDIPDNLSAIQFWALFTIATEGETPVGELAKAMRVSKTNMTSVIDRLTDEGFAERVPDSDDRRVVKLKATPNGIALLDRCEHVFGKTIKDKLNALGDENLSTLTLALKTIHEVLSAIE